jgi:aminoglycoside phosphotransferase (APT) family kinase protein
MTAELQEGPRLEVDLGPDLLDWVCEVTGAAVTAVAPAASGGRPGYHVDVSPGGRPTALYLQRGRTPGSGSFNSIEREAEILRALETLGVAAPHVWGVSRAHNVMLVDRLEGAVWFHEPADADQRLAVAQDFMRQLARWHATPAAELDIPSFKPVLDVATHQRDQLIGIRRLFETADAKAPIDELARASLAYLEGETPAYDGPTVLCQGDTGPGNFIYRGDKVVGVIDWELAHLGDPMDDIAWLSWRATQHGFPDFPARLSEYETLSGIKVSPERVRYYRVNACARLGPAFGLADMGQQPSPDAAERPAQDNDRTADGSQMVMSMLHRRMRLQALGEALGMELPSRRPPETAQAREHAPLYDNILRQLQVLAPQIADPKANSLAKGVARQIKYLKEVDRDGHLFEQQEFAVIAAHLGRTPASLVEGRAELAEAARAHRVSFEAYFHYHWNRMIRDDHLMRTASGRLYERSWPALV